MTKPGWTCTSCTFINQDNNYRCQMCHGHRPRSTAPRSPQSSSSLTANTTSRKKKQSTLIDLTATSGTNDNHDSDSDVIVELRPPPKIASTDSARKKKRKRKMLTSLVSNDGLSSSNKRHADKNTNGSKNRYVNGNSKRNGNVINESTVELNASASNKKNKLIKNGRCAIDLVSSSNIQLGKKFQTDHVEANFSNINDKKNKDKQQLMASKKTQEVYGKNRMENSGNINIKPDSSSLSSCRSSATMNNTSSSSSSYSSMTYTKPSSKVQQTLFGKIVDNIKRSNENDSTHENKIQHQNKTRQDSSSLSLCNTSKTSTPSSSSYSSSWTKSNYNQESHSFKKPKLSYDQLYQKAMHNLQTKFQIKSLRNLQPKAIQTALESKSQIIVMATGGGKSLCYQLPATVLDGITIVVSPLIALMVDQINNLKEKGIEAATISSMNTAKENNLVMKRLLGEDVLTTTTKKKGKNKEQQQQVKQQKPIKLVYCTPELIQTSRFRAVLDNIYKRNLLSLLAIDEAHCLSVWGQDFRPAYRELSYLRSSFPDVPLMACTATATEKVIKDIREVLCLNNGEDCHKSSFNRENVHYEIRYKDAMGDVGALQDLVNVVKKEQAEAAKKNQPCSGIVYVHKRDDTKLIAAEISKTGITAAPYHAGLKDQERKDIQEKWTNGTYQVAVATVAFGMGIDLAHVRYVLHWSMSKSVEGFYQESGRAGRDGLPSKSILYYSKEDASKFQFLIRKNVENKRANDVKKSRVSKSTDNQSMDALMKMIDYCTQPCCRRKYLLRHFGEDIDAKTVCQKTCDYCIDPNRMERAMEKGMAQRARRDVLRQQRALRNAKVWEGGYGGNYSDDSGVDEFDHDLGSGITSYSELSHKRNSGTSGFKSAKAILDHYESMECAGQKNGFVTFKRTKNKSRILGEKDENQSTTKENTRVKIPDHIRAQMSQWSQRNADSKVATIPKKEKGSMEYRSAAEKVRAELAAIRQKQKELQNQLGQS